MKSTARSTKASVLRLGKCATRSARLPVLTFALRVRVVSGSAVSRTSGEYKCDLLCYEFFLACYVVTSRMERESQNGWGGMTVSTSQFLVALRVILQSLTVIKVVGGNS